MPENPPYLISPGSLKKALDKLVAAQTPPRVTGDFVNTVIGIKGGTGRALIPFFKRIGLVRSDGVPTDLYNRFRNPTSRNAASAEALKQGFSSLYQLNEYIHRASDDDLKGTVIQATGLPHDSRVVAAICGTFKALKGYAKEGAADKVAASTPAPSDETEPTMPPAASDTEQAHRLANTLGLNLAYTINLNLPATTDVRVFDAIFKSLRANLLRE